MRTAALPLALLVCYVLSCARSFVSALDTASRHDDHQKLYDAAMAIRGQVGVSKKEQQRCVGELLLKAAGVKTARKSDPGEGESSAGPDSQGMIPVPGYPDLFFLPHGHKGALRELAKVAMEGWGCQQDAQLALELFRRAAALGEPEAQGQMAMRYALGLQYQDSWDEAGIVQFGEPDEDAALLHYFFAASGGDALARMALGYRHLHGLGVPKSCWTAAAYYTPVVEQVADLSVQPGGSNLPYVERIRLSVLFSQSHKVDRQREVVQFYQDSADKGNVDAQTTVAQVLNYGMHGMQRDHSAAMQYLQRAAEAGDVQAMGHLGNMYANGLAGEVDLAAARQQFESAAEEGGPTALYGLAYMHLTGQGADKDPEKALKLFVEAAEQGHVDAHYYLGVMHLQGVGVRRKSVQRAFSYLMLAAHAGHLLAMYNVAMMHLAGKGTLKNCRPASLLLKLAAERGPVAANLQQGHEAYFQGHYKAAAWHYLQAGEAGMELGQSNAAWLLAKDYVRAEGQAANVTFQLLKRSAEMGNVASLLAMADAYFHGDGVNQDWARSSAIYYEAYQERSPEAMFNLGFMHEFGAGVPQDLTLAGRFYDMALHTSQDAALAVYCAKAWLLLHQVWAWLRPRLPALGTSVWDNVFVLRPPHTSVLGQWTSVAASLLPHRSVMRVELGLWQWLQNAGLVDLATAVTGQKDVGETAFLAALVLLLVMVLRARQARVAHRPLETDEEARHRIIAEQIAAEGQEAVAARRQQHRAQLEAAGRLTGAQPQGTQAAHQTEVAQRAPDPQPAAGVSLQQASEAGSPVEHTAGDKTSAASSGEVGEEATAAIAPGERVGGGLLGTDRLGADND
ncbi:hypothetical protein V8C86DRAFT_2480771 [Haematococcus lacustris]